MPPLTYSIFTPLPALSALHQTYACSNSNGWTTKLKAFSTPTQTLRCIIHWLFTPLPALSTLHKTHAHSNSNHKTHGFHFLTLLSSHLESIDQSPCYFTCVHSKVTIDSHLEQSLPKTSGTANLPCLCACICGAGLCRGEYRQWWRHGWAHQKW